MVSLLYYDNITPFQCTLEFDPQVKENVEDPTYSIIIIPIKWTGRDPIIINGILYMNV